MTDRLAPQPQLWAVVPVKHLGRAKARLERVLVPAQRRELARRMLLDVLATLERAQTVVSTLVITPDAEAATLARSRGAGVLEEAPASASNPTDGPRGDAALNAALDQAARHLTALGAAALIVVPADVPLATPAEIDAVGHAACARSSSAGPAVIVVSDRHGTGTNCLACCPPDAIRFRFGPGSAAAHRESALRAGARAEILELPGLALDLDTEDDLERLVELPALSSAQAYLQECRAAREVR